jgi:hypothetical protein
VGADVDDHIFTVVDNMSDVNKNSIVNESSEAFQMNEDEDESSIASVEEQLKKEMTVYEVGLPDSFSSMFTTYLFFRSPFLSSLQFNESFYSSGCTAEIHHRNANQFRQYDTGQDTQHFKGRKSL